MNDENKAQRLSTSAFEEQEAYEPLLDDYESLKHSAEKATALKSFERGLELYKAALEKKPEFPEAYVNLGNAYKVLGQLDKAEICHKSALSYDDTYYRALHNLGVLYKQQGNYEQALLYLQKALENSPSPYITLNSLGNVFLNTEDYEKSEQLFKKAIEIDSKGFVANYNLALCYILQKQWERSIEIFELISVEVPKEFFVEFYTNLAQSYENVALYENAILVYEQLLTHNSDPFYYRQIIKILKKQHFNKECIPFYQKLLSVLSENTSETAELIDIYLNCDLEYEALPYLEESLKLHPEAHYYNFHYARLLHEKGFDKQALPYAEKAILLNSEHADSFALLGFIYANSNKEKAKGLFLQALAFCENSDTEQGFVHVLEEIFEISSSWNDDALVSQCVSKSQILRKAP